MCQIDAHTRQCRTRIDVQTNEVGTSATLADHRYNKNMNRQESLETPKVDDAVIAGLQEHFRATGCFRVVDPERREREGQKYKKGFEARFVADSEAELDIIRELLEKAGFKLGRPFKKTIKIIQPIYGRLQVERFLELMDRKLG